MIVGLDWRNSKKKFSCSVLKMETARDIEGLKIPRRWLE